MSRHEVSHRVRAFYEAMPFNFHHSTAEALHSLQDNPIAAYPDLDALLETPGLRVLEIGCGAGWAANAIALHYGHQVTAVDMTEKALARAADLSQACGTTDRIRFMHSDLFDFQTADRFDLVLSIGVLHHTADCRAAFQHISQFLRPEGHLFVGLYHLQGRRAFLRLFHEILAAEGEEAAFRRYAALNPGQTDETHLRSWFRDQVLHPQETQHSLAEVATWLPQAGLSLVSTSINGYGEVDDLAALTELEDSYEALSDQRNRIEGRYFPGFFTVLAQRQAAHARLSAGPPATGSRFGAA